MAKLTFALEDDQEIIVPLEDRITLGRSEDNDVVVDDERVSKHHAELLRNADGSIQLFDLDSTAGTFVNDERVRSHTVRHGDRINFGPLSACLNLEEPLAETPLPVSNGNHPANGKVGGRIPRRKREPGTSGRPHSSKSTALPAAELLAQQQAAAQQLARLLEEVHRTQEEEIAERDKFHAWQAQAEASRSALQAKVDALHSEEQRLPHLLTAVKEAEATHQNWLKAIQHLNAQHEEQSAALQALAAEHTQKAAELSRLANDEAAARNELETLATHRKQAIAHLEQIHADCAHDETSLNDLRHQLATTEARIHEVGDLVAAREDQIRVAEKKLDQLTRSRESLEERVHGLSTVETRLTQVLERCCEAESTHEKLATANASLEEQRQRAEASAEELNSQLAALEAAREKASTASAAAETSRLHAGARLKQQQETLAACVASLAARRDEIAAETHRLADIRAQRSDLERQCAELADTEQKIAAARTQLAGAKKQLEAVAADNAHHETLIATQQAALRKLGNDETEVRARIQTLSVREDALRAELSSLSASERTGRERFEEIRKLSIEAKKEHAAQHEKLEAETAATRQALEELLSRLTPLREWKEAMDGLYAKLATLPPESAAALALWQEIEKEKAGLIKLITQARAQGLPDQSATGAIPSELTEKQTTRQAPNNTITSPAATQETTLRARLAHLREKVRREEERLEKLRLEHVHHATPARSNPAAAAMLREQTRHLELKLRQEEERRHSLLHNIEVAQAEEEKRRNRLTEMEHKLAELRADIAQAEQVRGDLRQQADLIQTEIKNHEAMLERAKKLTLGEFSEEKTAS